jgi:hypothetical protein
MVKRMNDDDVMNYVYGKLFGDLDHIEAGDMFDKDDADATESTKANAEPEMKGSGGIKVTIEPLMAGAQESSKPSSGDDDQEDEDEDKLKGIADMSPLMAQLHGRR